MYSDREKSGKNPSWKFGYFSQLNCRHFYPCAYGEMRGVLTKSGGYCRVARNSSRNRFAQRRKPSTDHMKNVLLKEIAGFQDNYRIIRKWRKSSLIMTKLIDRTDYFHRLYSNERDGDSERKRTITISLNKPIVLWHSNQLLRYLSLVSFTSNGFFQLKSIKNL